MQLGVCTSVESAAAAKAVGWDYVEESVQGLLQGTVGDDQWKGPKRCAGAALPVPSANSLVPGDLKITGPQADHCRLRAYMENVLARAQLLGLKTLVFGSGAARQVPAGFDREEARQQIIAFVRMAAEIARQREVTIVAEPLNRHECNIVNSVGEAMTYVNAVDHPNFQCLVDSYHFWVEDEKLSDLAAAAEHIHHVHLADKDGRVGPGLSGTADYRPIFRILKRGGYDGRLSVEASAFKATDDTARRVIEFVRRQWEEA